MKNNDLKSRAVSGFFWKLAEKVGVYFVQFVIQIIVARILLPSEYGIVGLLSIFITISDVFIQQGLTTALIQKKNVDELDFSSVYFANVIMGLIIYAVLFSFAPLIAHFYNEENLVALLRILSLNVIFGSFGAVHNAILTRELEFRKSFYRNGAGVLAQGVVGIAAAILGCGAWALVYSKVANAVIGTIVVVITVKWKPKRRFSVERVKQLFGFSSKMLVNNLLNTIFNNINSLIIGHYYTSSDLGYYQRGQQMPQVPMTAIDGSFNEVLYPALSSVQDDLEKLKGVLRRSMKMSTFLVFPMLAGLYAVAEPLTVVLLTEKWLPAVPYFQLQCIICSFWVLSARGHALNAIGRSDVSLITGIISKIITLALLFAFIKQGIVAVMWATILTSVLCFGIGVYCSHKYIGYTFAELAADIGVSFVISVGMCGIVSLFNLLSISYLAKLVLQVAIGTGLYILGALLFQKPLLMYMTSIAKQMIKRG